MVFQKKYLALACLSLSSLLHGEEIPSVEAEKPCGDECSAVCRVDIKDSHFDYSCGVNWNGKQYYAEGHGDDESIASGMKDIFVSITQVSQEISSFEPEMAVCSIDAPASENTSL